MATGIGRQSAEGHPGAVDGRRRGVVAVAAAAVAVREARAGVAVLVFRAAPFV